MYFTVLRMIAGGHEKAFLKTGAFLCSICPVCMYTRSRPDSELAKMMTVVEKNCPFCMAFKKLKTLEDEEEQKESGEPGQEAANN